MSRSKSIIRDAAKFTISGYISSLFNFVSATIVRKILDPFFMGIYTELTLVFEYAKYNHLGILDSLDRQIPYFNGKREFKEKEEATNVGVSFSLFTSFISALLIILFSSIFKGRLSAPLSTGLKVIAVLVVIQSMTTFYVTLVRGHLLFGPLSKYMIIIAIFDIFLKAVLGIRFGVTGILWATVITLFLGLLYLFEKTKLNFRILLKIPKDSVMVLLGIGFPLLIAGFAFMVLRSIDRIMIIAFLTKEDLGFYSIAVMVHSFVFQFPNLIYTVLFPTFYKEFGSTEDLGELKGFLEKPTLAFAYLFPILIGLAVILLPLFVNYILPKYVRGIPAASILLFGTFFVSITNMSGYLLIALKKQNSLVLIGASCIAVSLLLNFVFVKVLGLGIEGIALGTSVTYFLYSLLLIGHAMKQYVMSLYDRLKFFISIYSPTIYTLLIFYIFKLTFPYSLKDLKTDIWRAFLQIVIFSILAMPLLVVANSKTELYSRIKNAGFSFFKR